MTQKQLRVLLVEDETVSAMLIGLMLEDYTTVKYVIDTVKTLKEAKLTLESNKYDVILLDLILPNGEGLSTVREVRKYAKDIPLVVVTGEDNDELALDTVREKAQDYLVKGKFNQRDLSMSIQMAIERTKVCMECNSVNQAASQVQETIKHLTTIAGKIGGMV